jgi:DNA-binding NtrC family response regulator
VTRCVHVLAAAHTHRNDEWSRAFACMNRKLNGRAILIVEADELSAMLIVRAFEDAGATVTSCGTVTSAMDLLETGMFSAAVLDHSLFEKQEDLLSLHGRRIPYVLHNGLIEVHGADCKVVRPPITVDGLIESVEKLIEQKR